MITIMIFVISAALTDFIRNTMFLFKVHSVPQKENVCFKAGTYKTRNLTLFFLSAPLVSQQACVLEQGRPYIQLVLYWWHRPAQ